MAVGEIVVDFHDRKVGLDKDGNFIVKTGGNIAVGSTPAELTATPAELNRVADVSGRIVSATAATLAVSEAAHDGKTIVLNRAGGVTATLPPATGSGARFRFLLGTALSAASHIIKVTGNDVMFGNIIANSTDDTPDLAQPWPTAADSDTITLDGTTTGGLALGDFVELEDFAADKWAVHGVVTASGTEATPFSATVA